MGGAAGGLDVQDAVGRGRVSPAAVHGPEQQGGGGALRTEQGVVLPLRFLSVADQPPVVPERLLQVLVPDVVVAEEPLRQRRREDAASGRHVVGVAVPVAVDGLLAVLHGEERAGRQAVLRHVAVVVVDRAPLALAGSRLTLVRGGQQQGALLLS